MDEIMTTDQINAEKRGRRGADHASGLSYKFQRLREQIRRAVASGELSGKLPGERMLADRFGVNAKTLSKALTDLAAEGLLERSIGRGTFVKGAAPQAASPGRWLVLCDPQEAAGELVTALKTANPETQIVTDVESMRPSLLNQFKAVIVACSGAVDSFLRDLSLRSIPAVLVNREPGTFSHHAVLVDSALAGARQTRELIMAGHRRLGVVEPRGVSTLVNAVRQTASRYTTDAIVEACDVEEIDSLLEHQMTAILCASTPAAARVKQALSDRGIQLPGRISLAAIGCAMTPSPCSGYFAKAWQIADSVAGLLRDGQPARPVVLWLAGEWHDAGTLGPKNTEPSLPHGEAALVLQPLINAGGSSFT